MDVPSPELYPNAAADPGTAAALRQMRRVVAASALLAGALLLGAIGFFSVAAHQSAVLLQTGVRTSGRVTDTWIGSKGVHYMSVEYAVGTATYQGVLQVSSSRNYRRGDRVTVVADPANPAHMRTLAESNESHALTISGILLLSFGLSSGLLAAAMGPTARLTRRRCEAARWVRVELGEKRNWRKAFGVTLQGEQVSVVVTPTRAPLLGSMWVLSDATPGRPVVVRCYRDGRFGGPIWLRTLRAWKRSQLTASAPATHHA